MSKVFKRQNLNTKAFWEGIGHFSIMNEYGEIAAMASRTYSRRSGIPGTAYFHVEKP